MCTTFLESGHAKVMATVEGPIQPGRYQVASRCSLSEQGAMEKASGGEPFFLMVMAEKPFSMAGSRSQPMTSPHIQDSFSGSYNRPLSRMQLAQSRQGSRNAGASQPAPPKLSEELAVGTYYAVSYTHLTLPTICSV